jgi:hypothetical protein
MPFLMRNMLAEAPMTETLPRSWKEIIDLNQAFRLGSESLSLGEKLSRPSSGLEPDQRPHAF